MFYEATDTSEGSRDKDSLDVLQGEKESLLSPLYVYRLVHFKETGELRH